MITVIIPAYNEEKVIQNCLESLVVQNPQPDEILIVENNSTDRTPEIIQAFIDAHPSVNIRMIHENKQGCLHARETGWRSAQGSVIVHVDADETFPIGWMAKIHKILTENPDLDAVGGVIRFENAPLIIWLTQVLYNRIYPYTQKAVKGFPYLCGGMTVVRREVLEAMDGYTAIPANQLDDYYLASKAHELGFKLHYTPSLWVNHSLRRYEEGGLKGFFQWGIATFDSDLYTSDVR